MCLYTPNEWKDNFFAQVSLNGLPVIRITVVKLRPAQLIQNIALYSEEEIQPQKVEELGKSPDEGEGKSAEDKKTLAKKEAQEDEIIEVKVDARLGEFTAVITSMKGDVAELQMKR